MKITAKADYAVRAVIELAAAAGEGPVKGEVLATAQGIPMKFLENILSALRHAGIVASQRGADGGYWLAKPADQVPVADIIRAVEGPLAAVRGYPPHQVQYEGRAEPLQRLWVAVRASLRSVLEHVTVADLVSGNLPPAIDELAADPDAWAAR